MNKNQNRNITNVKMIIAATVGETETIVYARAHNEAAVSIGGHQLIIITDRAVDWTGHTGPLTMQIICHSVDMP